VEVLKQIVEFQSAQANQKQDTAKQ